jgi:lysozyme
MAEITRYFEIIENHYQRKVLIYTTNEFYKNCLINRFPDNPIWIRDIVTDPKLPDGRNWLFWQYTNKGKIEGISTSVDLNAFAGSREEFEKLIQKEIPQP